MSEWTNCPNCGAVVDPAADRCAYCDTPYPIRLRAELYQMRMDQEIIVRNDYMGILTPNEARRLLGLPPKQEV